MTDSSDPSDVPDADVPDISDLTGEPGTGVVAETDMTSEQMAEHAQDLEDQADMLESEADGNVDFQQVESLRAQARAARDQVDQQPAAPSKPSPAKKPDAPDLSSREKRTDRPDGGGAGGSGFTGKVKRRLLGRRGGSDGGNGSGRTSVALIGQVNILSNNRGEANAVKASASGNTGASVGLPRGASGRAAARRAGRGRR